MSKARNNYRGLIQKRASKVLRAYNVSEGVGDEGDGSDGTIEGGGMNFDKKEIGSPMEFEFDGETLHLDMSKKYQDGKPAILVMGEDGIPYATLSTNVDVDLEPGEVLIKNYSENTNLANIVLSKGWFTDTGKRVESGFVQIPIWRIV